MDINNIKDRYNTLRTELKQVVAKMERSDRVFAIRDEIKELQNMCPHNMGSYDFSTTDECPYCGRKFEHKNKETNPDWVHGIKMY